MQMITLKGKGVCNLAAVGRITFFKKNEIDVERETVSNTGAEICRFDDARKKAMEELTKLYRKTLQEIGEEQAQIFDIHKMMLEDLDFVDGVKDIIKNEKVNAEYAVEKKSEQFSEMLKGMDDEYMKERAQDVLDVKNRLLRIFYNEDEETLPDEDGLIICADDLTPSQTVQLDKSRIKAFVTKKGSQNSHTAILARTMNIPAVIGVIELENMYNGKIAAVDGESGTVYIDPDENTLKEFEEKIKIETDSSERLKKLIGSKSVTKDGKEIMLFANIGGLSDLERVIKNDAEGIGLFRSEFLYLESRDFPTEEVQFKTYKTVLEKLSGKKVVIRTMDIGADKQIEYFNLDKEENPALGFRAIRICLSNRDIFKTQLRALLRASVYGKLSIMLPMIVSKDEIIESKRIIEEVKEELKKEGKSYSENVEIGIMIETPAAAIISDELASEVDFFSVGTNDLTQYTLAADRQNPKLEELFDSHHEAVLRLIETAAENAHKHGKWIGICGELGADLTLTERFLQMGIDELSVTPSTILKLREKINNSYAFKK